MRGVASWGLSALVALLLGVAAAAAKPGQVSCPLQPGSPSGGAVQWAFSDSGRPVGNAVKSAYVHGRGNWKSGRATGTACATDSRTNGGGERDVVLTVSGRSKLTGRVTQGGLLGVRIVLPMKVRASDDKPCADGATGTITLFASYYSVHRDTMNIRFSSRCTEHNLSYGGSALHVYIAPGRASEHAVATRDRLPPPRDRAVMCRSIGSIRQWGATESYRSRVTAPSG